MFDRGRQFAQRVSFFREELKRHLYTPIAPVSFSMMTTTDRLTPDGAAEGDYFPCPEGTKWGGAWEYGWFRGQITLPECCLGRRVVFLSGLGGEQLVYANGHALGSIDHKHAYVTLRRSALPGEEISLLIESYAGHGARLENLGPWPKERPAIPPIPESQCTVKKSWLALWNESAYQLHLDVEALCSLATILPEKSLRLQRVQKALDDFTHIADFEEDEPHRTASFENARNALRDAMGCKNGSTAPLMWLLGQSHIDLAWLWPLEESWHKVARTYANQLQLMEEYPEYNFLLCEPALMEMLRTQHPDLWERVLLAHARGQILPEGAFYVECDTNIPSGESLIRQLMWGKKWYRDHFQMESKVAWQPDTFGFSPVLPQLLKGFDVPFFATQKLLRADPECERFPYQDFWWEGMDGTKVQALSFFKNNAQISPAEFNQRWEQHRTQQEDIDTLLYPFGFGDGGGGATRDMVENARRLKDLEGAPRAQYGGLREYFENRALRPIRNQWTGELYLPWHRGTYTAQRKTKALIRRLQEALHDAEMLLCALPKKDRSAYAGMMHQAWETLLIHQFHDIAGGVGIRRVHKEAENALSQAIETIRDQIAAWQRQIYQIKEKKDTWMAFNSLPFERQEWVRLPDGEWRYAKAPALGIAPLSEEGPGDAHGQLTEQGILMENDCLSILVDEKGRICRCLDKRNGLSLLAEGQYLNDLRLYQNIECVYDAWELSRDWESRRLVNTFTVHCELTKSTPALCEVTARYTFGESSAVGIIRLFAGAGQVEFDYQIHWQGYHQMLKNHFESNILCENALHEMQFGYVSRPAHRSHAHAADRYEVCNHRYTALCEGNRGMALINDGSYGVSTDRGEIALTLLRAPLVPDDTADRGDHRIRWALRIFDTPFAESGVIQAGYAFNQPLQPLAGEGKEFPSLQMQSDSVILETVKPAEDGRGVILRFYEALGMQGEMQLSLPGRFSITDCGMNEEGTAEMEAGNQIKLHLRPFEIRTLRLMAE